MLQTYTTSYKKNINNIYIGSDLAIIRKCKFWRLLAISGSYRQMYSEFFWLIKSTNSIWIQRWQQIVENTVFRVFFCYCCSNTAEVRTSLKWVSGILTAAESTHNTKATWSWSCSYLCQALGGCRSGEAGDSHIQDDLTPCATAFFKIIIIISLIILSPSFIFSLYNYFFITNCLHQISDTTVNSSAAINQNITINTGLQM